MQAKIGNRLLATLKPKEAPYEVWDSDLAGFVLRIQPTNARTYYAAYRLPDGRNQRMRLGTASLLTPAQAREQAKLVLADATKGIDPNARKRTARAHTLRTFIEGEFEPWAVSNRKSGRDTVMRLKSCFAGLLDVKLTDFTAWHVEKLRAAWVKETGIKATGNRDIACMKGMFSRAVEWGHLKENPIKAVKLGKTDAVAKIRIMTPEEETRLWAALDAREEGIRAARASHNAWCRERHLPEWPDLRAVTFADYLKPMITILLHTGMRRGEAFSLEWRDVDFTKQSLTVRGECAKSGKTRVIPLNTVALETLTAWRAQSPEKSVLVFPNTVKGGRLTHINTSWRALVKAAKTPGLRTHDLRHTFASRCLARGADINTVKELLGHSDIKTTAIYLHSRAEDKAAAVARLVAPDNIIQLAEAQGEKDRP